MTIESGVTFSFYREHPGAGLTAETLARPTQTELAERMEVNQATISRVLRGETIGPEVAEKAMDALHVPSEYRAEFMLYMGNHRYDRVSTALPPEMQLIGTILKRHLPLEQSTVGQIMANYRPRR